MHPALQGFLTGLVIAVVLLALEYLFVKKAVEERAQLHHRKPEFEPTDTKRIKSLATFVVFLPPALALGFWLVWG